MGDARLAHTRGRHTRGWHTHEAGTRAAMTRGGRVHGFETREAATHARPGHIRGWDTHVRQGHAHERQGHTHERLRHTQGWNAHEAGTHTRLAQAWLARARLGHARLKRARLGRARLGHSGFDSAGKAGTHARAGQARLGNAREAGTRAAGTRVGCTRRQGWHTYAAGTQRLGHTQGCDSAGKAGTRGGTCAAGTYTKLGHKRGWHKRGWDAQGWDTAAATQRLGHSGCATRGGYTQARLGNAWLGHARQGHTHEAGFAAGTSVSGTREAGTRTRKAGTSVAGTREAGTQRLGHTHAVGGCTGSRQGSHPRGWRLQTRNQDSEAVPATPTHQSTALPSARRQVTGAEWAAVQHAASARNRRPNISRQRQRICTSLPRDHAPPAITSDAPARQVPLQRAAREIGSAARDREFGPATTCNPPRCADTRGTGGQTSAEEADREIAFSSRSQAVAGGGRRGGGGGEERVARRLAARLPLSEFKAVSRSSLPGACHTASPSPACRL
jgi:hypothetical protein